MRGAKISIIARTKTVVGAHAAALRHGRPSRKLKVILVAGQDGASGTVAFLASILQEAGNRVGVCTQNYVQIADERVGGSDQADIHGDPFRLQALLAQMRKAGCNYALIEVPPELPPYQFVGIHPTMLIIRRCGDNNTDQITTAARLAMLNNVLARRPQFVVYNRDDPSSAELSHLAGQDGVISFGTHKKSECKLTEVALHPKGSTAHLVVDHQTELQLTTQQAGKQAIYNATAAAAAAYVLRVPIELIEQGVAATPLLPGNFEYIPIERPYQLAIDSALTPGGLAETLETIRHFTKNRLIVVFGAPLGVMPGWYPLLGEIAGKSADRLIVTDGEFLPAQSAQQVREQIIQGASAMSGEAKTEEIPDRLAAIEKAVSIARRDDVVLIAGSTQRPYRQLGDERLTWSDHRVAKKLFEA